MNNKLTESQIEIFEWLLLKSISSLESRGDLYDALEKNGNQKICIYNAI